MRNGKRVLIGDNSYEFGRLLSKILRDRGFEVLCRRNDISQLKSEILSSEPDAAVICVYSGDSSPIKLISDISAANSNTGILAVAYSLSDDMCRDIVSSGAARCILMPASLKSIASVIYEISSAPHQVAFEPEIISFLIESGFPSHLNGLYYLSTAAGLCIVNPEYISDITNSLYEKLAEIYNTTPLLIERSIRHVALLAHENGSDMRLSADPDRIFSAGTNEPLTNYELICLVADAFSRKYGLFP